MQYFAILFSYIISCLHDDIFYVILYLIIIIFFSKNILFYNFLQIYDKLQGIPGLNVYKKEEIPEHYHIKHNRLVLPLLLVASKNYYIRGVSISSFYKFNCFFMK